MVATNETTKAPEPETEQAPELLTPDQLIAHLIEDIVADNSVDDLADEFINDFVTVDRPETLQILSMLESSPETLIGILKAYMAQGFDASTAALDQRGAIFINSLQIAVRSRMVELADDAS